MSLPCSDDKKSEQGFYLERVGFVASVGWMPIARYSLAGKYMVIHLRLWGMSFVANLLWRVAIVFLYVIAKMIGVLESALHSYLMNSQSGMV